MGVGENIAKYRKEAKLTQQQLGNMVGVNFKTVSKWELNQNEPDIETIIKMSNLFHVSVDKLLGNSLENIHNEEEKEKSFQNKIDDMETKLENLEKNVQKMEDLHNSFNNMIQKEKKDSKKNQHIVFFTIALAIGCVVLAITVIYLIKIQLI